MGMPFDSRNIYLGLAKSYADVMLNSDTPCFCLIKIMGLSPRKVFTTISSLDNQGCLSTDTGSFFSCLFLLSNQFL